jgi:predicted dehydrogenase
MKRIGLIGCGIVTIKAHLSALLNDPTQPLNEPEFVITAICGLEEDKLKYIQYKLPAVEMFSEYQKLIDSGLVDCVFVATGERLHLEIAEYALQKDMYVMIEKPASTNAVRIQKFIKDNSNKLDKLQIAFNKRFYPGILKAKELESTGEFSEVIGGNIYFLTQQGRKPGKEGILSNLIHLCDEICYLFGEPEDVTAHFSGALNDEKAGKTISASILTKQGASVAMLFTSSSNWNLPYHEQIQMLDNQRNRISIENNNKLIFTKCTQDKKINTQLFEQSNSIFWNKDPYGYKTQITEFYKLVSGQSCKPAVDIYNALAAHKLFESIFEFDNE